MKIAIVQFNPTLGAIEQNLGAILAQYQEASQAGADLVIFPECALTGYPLEDLVLRESFMDAVGEANNTIRKTVYGGHGAKLIYGTPEILAGTVQNCAVYLDPFLQLRKFVSKTELPNYGVFDEKRVFASAEHNPVLNIYPAGKVGLMICEDCWFSRVSAELIDQGAELLISINGSPFEVGKNVVRRKVIKKRMQEFGKPFLYVNMVGGQDELVFDGGSFFYDGKTIQEAPHFKEGIFYFEYDPPALETDLDILEERFDHFLDNYPEVSPSGIAEIYQALVLGTRDYLRKTYTKSVVLGYSGGVDSGLVAAIACDAIGQQNVNLVRLPSKFSSQHSLDDAAAGAERLGAKIRTVKIEPVVAALRYAYSSAFIENPPEGWEPNDAWPRLSGVGDENIQARARGNILMAISNQEGHMVLTTGNKSEVSVGYATLYGDMSGGYNPIKDCYKTTVWDLCRWRNALTQEQLDVYGFLGRATEVVPEEIINKPPSAELRENQQDTDSLPEYPVLDALLKGFIEDEKSVKQLVAEGVADIATTTRIRKLVDLAEYKRRQAAPGVKITSKIFGRDRRYPIVNHWRDLA